MNFFDRLSLGWRIAMNAFRVLRSNKQLILFPVLSGLSLLLILGSFLGVFFAVSDVDALEGSSEISYYIGLFLFYLVNYFVVTFFNMALVHCTHLYFNGEEVSVGAGVRFSLGRLPVILSWAAFAATVGTILRVVQENVGIVGKIITALIGVVWSVATFFVVPVIAYENIGPIDAVKRSTQLMRQKWGERIGAGFSFGLVNLLGILLLVLPLVLLGLLLHPLLAVALGITGLLLVMAVMSAARTIFISSVYHNINGRPTEHFDQQLVDSLFTSK